MAKTRKAPDLKTQTPVNSGGSSEDVGSDSEHGSREIAEEKRSKSSLDVRENGDDSSAKESSLRRKWHSFKTKTRRFRSRSREKLSKKNREDSKSTSQPDISGSDSPAVSPSGIGNGTEFDQFFESQKHSLDQSFSAEGEINGLAEPLKDQLTTEKNGEADSGIAGGDSSSATNNESLTSPARPKHDPFRGHAFFVLEVVLKEGRDLVIRDSCGTSDPYVRFKIAGKQYYKSRIVFKNLNPRWDEKFTLPVEDPYRPISVKVMDYDRGLNDDPMGGAEIDLSDFDLNKPKDLKLMLGEKNTKQKDKYMGYLLLTATLIPKTQDEKEQELFLKKSMKSGDSGKKTKTQIWSSVVTVVLVEGYKLLPMDDNGFSDPYVKFRLGNEKYKSKWKAKTLDPRWLEQFDLHMFDDQTSHLEISVWDHDAAGKDDIMGRAGIDLTEIEREKTHTIDLALEDGAGFIKILLTISGTTGSETISDLSNFVYNPREREDIVRSYGLLNSFKAVKDVGWLQVKVIKAQGLASADLGGKSDPFCVLELVNSRLQTHTEYKTLYPEWGKIFTFNVKDIHAILEVTVYDEDRDKKIEFLGKVAIPLLRIHRGERRWYQLKDHKLLKPVKGAIQLEMDLIYNHIKAAIRTFNPREEKYMQPEPKFKIAVLKRNIDRVQKLAEAGVEAGKFLQSCFDWESAPRSISAFAVFLIVVWNFELYMLPVTLLIVFLKNLLIVHIVGNLMKDKDEDEYVDEEDEDEEEEKEKKPKQSSKEEKTSFKQKLQQINDICLQVQEGMDMAASMGERVKNTFNWTVPWLSWLAVVLLSAGVLVLYYIPLRYLIMAFGINKFTKKLRAPNAIPNNELLDYLSRVPSDKELIMYRELRPDSNIGTMKKKKA